MTDALLSIGVLLGILIISAIITEGFARAMYKRCAACQTLNAKRRTQCRACQKEFA